MCGQRKDREAPPAGRCLAQQFPLTVWAAMSEHEQATAARHCTLCEQEIEQEHADAQRRADRAR